METQYGQLTYCSNIHPGESWKEHFIELKKNLSTIKTSTSPHNPMGLGLRLSNQASIDLLETSSFEDFKLWLHENNIYVFTMNGFPYGNFHNDIVKDNVHTPDWTTNERREYTIRLFEILSALIPKEINEGGISTSPLSYKFWWETDISKKDAIQKSTQNILLVLDFLITLFEKTNKIFHLDIEPEPDGVIENINEYIEWYNQYLIPMGIEYLKHKNFSNQEVINIIKRHIQLCYDVCHFAIEHELPELVIEKLEKEALKVGKIQISSALKVNFDHDALLKIKQFDQFNEPIYLHQVVAKLNDGSLQKFPDLPQAIQSFHDNMISWRIHFHVPIFLEQYGLLESTQSDIIKIINLQKNKRISNHLEIETYTWNVLPNDLKTTLDNSIIREINWIKKLL